MQAFRRVSDLTYKWREEAEGVGQFSSSTDFRVLAI